MRSSFSKVSVSINALFLGCLLSHGALAEVVQTAPIPVNVAMRATVKRPPLCGWSVPSQAGKDSVKLGTRAG
jgi:hypothetical protein